MSEAPHELKALQVRARRLEGEIAVAEGERNRLQREIGDKKSELNRLRQAIDAQTAKEPVVTEHAMLRYIQRVMGVDLDEVQARILTEGNRKAIKFARSCRIKTGEGIEFVVQNGHVVSVVEG